MEIQYSQLKINHLKDMPSTKAAGGRIYSGVLLKDVKVPVKVRRTLSSVGTSSSNICTKPLLLNCFESFAQPCLSQYQSLLRIVTLTTCDRLFGNLKRQERQVAETAPKCHRVMRRVGFQKATQLLSHICYPPDTRQLTSPQGEADVWSLEGV
jgi:hypothetical protein